MKVFVSYCAMFNKLMSDVCPLNRYDREIQGMEQMINLRVFLILVNNVKLKKNVMVCCSDKHTLRDNLKKIMPVTLFQNVCSIFLHN